jgi:hypothetical protein
MAFPRFTSRRLVLSLVVLSVPMPGLFQLSAAASQGPFRNIRLRRQTPFTVSLTVAPTQIGAGGTATYTVTISRPNQNSSVSVNYAMSGTAIEGTDYTLNTFTGQIVIQRGATTGSVTLNAADSSSSGNVVATMTLQPGSGYAISSPNAASVAISFSDPTPAQEYWIAVRTDGQPGSGTEADPYNGSTQQRFDTLMASMPPNTEIHLGPGTFQTDISKTWFVQPGWILEGEGIDVTTIQMVGDASGINWGESCLKSNAAISTDNVTIRDLTCDANWAVISQTADRGVDGEKNIKTGAIALWGSNNLIDHVRSINTYGSRANHQEQFVFLLTGPASGDGTGDVIQYCSAEQPYGDYGSPFALAGWMNAVPYHLLTDSKVISCTAIGLNSGVTTGFTTGGVNIGNVENCQIDGNTFIDCYGAAYSDTGSMDGLQVTNNTVVRGWEGVGLRSSAVPKQNITVSGNNVQIQNRVSGGGSYAFYTDGGTTTNLVINNNMVTFDSSGGGLLQLWAARMSLLNNSTISNNTIEMPPNFYNSVTGTNVTMFNNVTPDGTPIPGLN